jgi:2-methylcitrate dehydratase PrpD
MEVSSRIGVAGTSSIIYERGFHPVSAVGPFASVIVAGRLLGLSAPLLVNAISIAASHAGGTTEYSQSGGNVKRLHAGIACAAGVRSARLARAGLTGPATIIEGRRGFLSAFSSRPDAELVREGLGVNWEVEGLAIKPYSCCAMIHAPIGAIRQILDAEEIRPSDIAKVHVSSNRLAKVHVGSVGPRPTTVEGAQFSMEFSVALALAGRGNDPAAYLEAQRTNFEDPIVRSIAERVELDVGEEPDAAFPEHFMADVELQMKDGRKRHARAYAKGTEDDPMSGEETEEKVRAMLIGRGVERDLVEQLIIFIGRIESFEDPSHLTYILQYAVPRSD